MSPAATATVPEARDAILHSADELFYNQGVAAVTMADIRDASGVSMRRLYSLYPAKSDLVTGWLEHRHHEWGTQMRHGIHDAQRAGATPLDALFESLANWLTATNFRGCGFINTFAERSNLTNEQLQIIRRHKADLGSYLKDLVPSVPGLLVLVDGAIVQSAMFADLAPLHSAHQLATALAETNPS